MQDLKMTDQMSGHENAGSENKGLQKQDRKMEDKCNSGKLSQQRSVLFKHCNGATGPGHGGKNYNGITTQRLIVYSFPLIDSSF